MFKLKMFLMSLVLISQPGCGCAPSKHVLEHKAQEGMKAKVERSGNIMTRVPLKYKILLLVFGFAVLVDQFTKHLVLNFFELGESKSIVAGFFSFTSIRNPGAAFGFLAQADSSFRVPFFILVPFIALGVICYLFLKLQEKDVKQSIALSLIAGGALGNLIDRIQLGHVVDFLDFHFRSQWHYPAFNFADVAICTGVGILIFGSFAMEVRKQPSRGEARKALS